MSDPRDAPSAGFMELRFALQPPKPTFTPKQLLDAARAAEIHTTGWPLGVVLDVDQFRPHPTRDGIEAEVRHDHRYDFWSMRTNGDFYLLQSLAENFRAPQQLFVDMRVVRVTEAFLYCVRLYSHLEVDPGHLVHVGVRHGGLVGRTLGSASVNRPMRSTWTSTADEADTTVTVRLSEIEPELVGVVKETCAPLLMLFDFFELTDPVYESIVSDFVDGRIV